MAAEGESSAVTSAAHKRAYVCHVVLAVLLSLALAMQIHLWVIDAKGDVVGAGIFLVVMWLGLPALVSAILATYYSLKASDTRFLWLLMAMALPILAILFNAPRLLLVVLQAAYIVLVIVVGVLSRRKRGNEA